MGMDSAMILLIDVLLGISLSVPRVHFKYKESVRNCAKDEGWPLGTGLQELVSNRLKLRW